MKQFAFQQKIDPLVTRNKSAISKLEIINFDQKIIFVFSRISSVVEKDIFRSKCTVLAD